MLEGAVVSHLARRGKQIAVVAEDGRTLIVQLGMTGSMLVLPSGASIRSHTHVHAVWTTPDSTIIFRDPRRFGGITAVAHHSMLESVVWRELGPDALGVASDELAQRGGRSSRAIKTLLLDQRVLAGVGNIYADESLFLAAVAPQTPAKALEPPEWVSLASAIRTVLGAAVVAGGSTLRDYVDAQGNAGTATQAHQVYGRKGQPCIRCGTRLLHTMLGQRSTVWCPQCQPPRHAASIRSSTGT